MSLAGKIFYTTKPIHFLDSWHLYLYTALFTNSFACIPLVAAHSHRLAGYAAGNPKIGRIGDTVHGMLEVRSRSGGECQMIGSAIAGAGESAFRNSTRSDRSPSLKLNG